MSATAATRGDLGLPTDEARDDASREQARRAVRLAGIVVLAVVVAGLLAIPLVDNDLFAASSLFFQQFAQIEGAPLLLIAAFVIVVLIVNRRASAIDDSTLPEWSYRPWVVVLGAGLVVLAALAGIRWVFHGYFLADDEYSAWFQAIIFAHGKMSATVPSNWCRWITAITPTAVYSSPQTCTWRLSYLPIHSLLQAPFIAAGIGRLGVPLLSGLSVLLVASIARKLWPTKPLRAYVAALFMVTSAQVLFMSMTMFSMVSHLFVSLVWLWLYVDDRRWSNVLLPWIGVIALGVHSPFPHAFLVTSFVLRYLRKQRFVMFGYVSVVYGFGLMYWFGYLSSPTGGFTTVASATATVAQAKGVFALPSMPQSITTAMHLALLVSWNAPIAILLSVAAMISWKRLDAFSRDAVLSIMIILIARTLMATSQGEGWGYRFAYDGLAPLALLSAVGFEVLAESVGARAAKQLVWAAVVATVLIQLPVRVRDVDRVVGPYQRGFAWMESLPYDAVVYPTIDVLWGRQLVQNDPFFRNRPLIISASELSGSDYQALMKDQSKRIFVIPPDSIHAHGFPQDLIRLGSIVIKR